jgi:hypothetical protein
MPGVDLLNSILGRLGEAAIGASGSYEAAKLGTEAQRYVADLGNRLGYFQTRQGNKQRTYEADLGANTARYEADSAAGTARAVSGNNLRGVMYGADSQERTGRYQSDVAAGTSRYQTDAERAIAEGRLGFDYAGLGFKKDSFNRVFGLVNPLVGQFGAAAGDSGIDVRGVYSPTQVNQQVASGRSQVAGQAALLARQQRQAAAGRGLGSQSPILAALLANTAARSVGQGVDVERETRLSSAQANAQQILAAQQARSSAGTARLSALASLLGSAFSAV